MGPRAARLHCMEEVSGAAKGERIVGGLLPEGVKEFDRLAMGEEGGLLL